MARKNNGSTEALVKTVKKALVVTVGEHPFTFSEHLTIMFETAELVNERPIGLKSLTPEDGTYLCPNDLLLGRSTSHVPQGPFDEQATNKSRHAFLQAIITNFWKRWTREVFPNLVIQPKWHVQRRSVKVGDTVLLQDSNVVRGEWKMGVITDTTASRDNRIRKVDVMYKRDNTSITVSRPVQKLIVLVPIDENSDKESENNPAANNQIVAMTGRVLTAQYQATISRKCSMMILTLNTLRRWTFHRSMR